MSACRYLELVEELGDGTLAPALHREVRGHLDGCEACRHRYDATTRLIAAAAALPDLDPPTDLFERAFTAAGPLGAARPRRPLDRLREALAGRVVAIGLAGAVAASLGLFAWSRGVARRPALEAKAPSIVARELGVAAVEAAAAAPTPYEDALAELAPLIADTRARWTPADAARIDRAITALDAEVARAQRAAAAVPGDLALAQELNDVLRARLELAQAALLDPETAALGAQANLGAP